MRTLANPGASGNSSITSCPTPTSGCPGDLILARDVLSVTTRYFSKSGNIINYTSVIDPEPPYGYIGPDFSSVEVAELTVRFKKKAIIHGLSDSKSETTIRVALRNG